MLRLTDGGGEGHRAFPEYFPVRPCIYEVCVFTVFRGWVVTQALPDVGVERRATWRSTMGYIDAEGSTDPDPPYLYGL